MVEAPIPLVCILGPTGAGKTRLAACLAATLPGEVIGADSRQVYRHMDVGTGKDLADYVVDGKMVRYHLIDIVDPGYEYNLYEYKRDCVAAIQNVHARKLTPVLCGGTGLYLSAVLQDYQLLPAPPDAGRRAELEALPTDDLIARLRSHGDLHNTTDTEDRGRLIRAIEVAEADPGGRVPALALALDAHVHGIRWEREALRERLTRRLAQRLEQGLIEEVEALLGRGLTPEQLIFYGLEYRFVTQHVRGDITWQQMFDSLSAAIHQLAKRQDTWFRRMQRQGVEIRWLDGRVPPHENASRILDSLSL